jgi:NarL family two-component system sensor histidine kinase LiaS
MDENKIRSSFPFLYPTYYQCYLIALRSSQKLLGMIGLLTRSGRVLAINTLSLAVIMAENVSIALEREELRKQAEQAAIIQERQRISRDLHDAVSQSLSSACMIASATRKYLDKENWEALRQSVTDFQKAAYQSLREMRLLLYQLRPISDAPFDAVKSLQKRLDLVERRAGLEVEVELEHFERLPKAVQQTMFIIAQEALNNIVKHAYGSKVWVLFFRQHGTSGEPEVGEPHQPCRWVLEIRDDGEGFDQNKVSPGFGLNNMSERAREAGLGWEIQSQKGKGTTVRVIYEEPHG